MDQRKRRDQQILYITDEAVLEEQKKCRAILQKLNFMDRADFDGIGAVVKELFGSSDGAFVNPHFTAITEAIFTWERISLPIITA